MCFAVSPGIFGGPGSVLLCKGNSEARWDAVVTLGKGGDPKVSYIAQSKKTNYYEPGQGRGSKENEGEDPSLPQETTYRRQHE